MREVIIDLAALKANLRYLKAKSQSPIMAVVKADAYGHGLIPCAKAAIEAGADWLGVALLDEAITLRDAGLTAPILAWLLPPGENYELAVKKQIDLGVSTLAAFDQISAIPKARIHLEVETGMGRGGFASEWPDLLKRDLSKVVGIFTHLARADEPNEVQNQIQLAKFNEFTQDLKALGIDPIKHVANSAATISNPAAKFDLVRVGIAMYGLSPLGRDENLKPAMKVRAKLVLVKNLPAGHPIGYGATALTTSDTNIGIVSMGYADGIPRNAREVGITYEGKAAPIIGRVSMDQFAVDLGADTNAKSGDWVTVIGGAFDAYSWAKGCQTIHYEITTRMAPRVARIYED